MISQHLPNPSMFCSTNVFHYKYEYVRLCTYIIMHFSQKVTLHQQLNIKFIKFAFHLMITNMNCMLIMQCTCTCTLDHNHCSDMVIFKLSDKFFVLSDKINFYLSYIATGQVNHFLLSKFAIIL